MQKLVSVIRFHSRKLNILKLVLEIRVKIQTCVTHDSGVEFFILLFSQTNKQKSTPFKMFAFKHSLVDHEDAGASLPYRVV